MELSSAFLGNVDGGAYQAVSSVSWWQTLGGLVVVFGLLMVCLKILGKLNRRTMGTESSLLTVWHLGPKKEIQVLRLGDQVHYIYRHDGAMVVLQTEPHSDYERKRGQLGPEPSAPNWRNAVVRHLPFLTRQSSRNALARNTRTRQAQG